MTKQNGHYSKYIYLKPVMMRYMPWTCLYSSMMTNTPCLTKDKESLLTFYDFPAKHWQHIRTTNPIEATFATIRHRTKRSKGCLNKQGILTMMFKLALTAQKRWRKIRGCHEVKNLLNGTIYINGETQTSQKTAA